MNLFDVILERGLRRPDAPALRDARGRVTTFADLRDGALHVARRLSDWGIGPGDGVLLAARTSPQALMAALGIARAGATAVLADPGAGDALAEARRRVAPARAAVAESIVHAASSPIGRWLTARLPATRGLQLPDLTDPDLRHLVVGPWLPGVPRGAQRLLGGSSAGTLPDVNPDADVLVVFTSGSTAAPRAVVHTHATLGAGLHLAVEALGWGPHTVLASDQLMLGLLALAAGGRWSLSPVTAQVPAWLQRAHRDGATDLYGLPRKALAAHGHGLPPGVRQITMGGAPVLPSLIERLQQPGLELVGIYAMTECLPVAVARGPEILDSPADAVVLGRPVPGTTVEVRGGELVVSGPQVRDRYVGQPRSREVRTGDLGRVDDDGRILLSGRAKRMIIRGHANIYPDLVEPLLVDDVGLADAALVGRADPVTGDERVLLYVVGDTSDQVIHGRWGELADESWRPDQIIRVGEIPRRGRSREVDLDALGERA